MTGEPSIEAILYARDLFNNADPQISRETLCWYLDGIYPIEQYLFFVTYTGC